MAGSTFKTIDTTSGAPKKVRAIVGNFDDPDRRLEAIKQFYPDAVSTAGSPMGEDNFIYTNPSTGQKTLYNPKGLDFGDVISVGRDIVSTISGGIGGTSALVAGQMGPQIATPEEAVTVPAAAALASEAGGQLYDRAVDAFLPDPFSVSRGGPVEQTSKAATNVGMEIVGGKIAEKTIDAVKGIPSAVTRTVAGIGKKRQSTAQERLAEAARFGITLPSAGTTSQSPVLMFLEQRLNDFPTSAPMIFEKFDTFRTQAGQAAQDVASRYGRPVQEGGEIGSILQTGAEKGLAKFKRDQTKLYDAAYDLAPNATGRLNNVMELRAKLLEDLSKAPESLLPSMKAALDEVERLIADSQSRGGVDLSTLRQLRTNLRRKTDGMTQQGGGDAVSYLKTVYKSLTNDMNEAVVNYGGEDAVKALSKADTYTKNRQKFDVEPVYDQLHRDKKNEVQAFTFLMQGTKEGGAKLKKILRNIPAAERGDIQASILSRLGMTNPAGQDAIEDFSTAKFITNYSKLSDSAKDALFGKSSNRKDLDDLVAMFDDIKSADAFANNSRTGQSIGTVATVSPLIGGLYMIGTDPSNIAGAASTAASGMVGALLTPYVSARLLTKPEFIKWLVKAGPQMGKNPNSAKFHLGRLMEISSRDSQFREDAMEYVDAFGSALVEIHNRAVEANNPDEAPQVEINQSPAADSIIQSLTPDAAAQLQEAAQ